MLKRVKSASHRGRAVNFFPGLDLFQFLDALEEGIFWLVAGLRFRAVQARQIIRIDVIEQAIDHPVALIQIDAIDFEIFPQDADPLRIFPGQDPVQVQPPALARDAGIVGLIPP